jgi:hypothetical protein
MSTPTIIEAPDIRAPWTTESPTPPRPKTTTVSPGRTFAVFTTAPMPVGTPHPSRQARSKGRELSTLATEISGSTT